MSKIENGAKGGKARASKYKKLINEAIYLFINSNLNQQEIANKLNVSQAFVSIHTNSTDIKIARLKNQNV